MCLWTLTKLPASFTKQYFVSFEKHTVIEIVCPDVHAGNSNCFLNKEGYLGDRHQTGFGSKIGTLTFVRMPKNSVYTSFFIWGLLGNKGHLPFAPMIVWNLTVARCTNKKKIAH